MNPTDPAFPVPPMTPKHQGGMDLRTYMATQILQGLLAHSAGDAGILMQQRMEGMAVGAVDYADALIARLNSK